MLKSWPERLGLPPNAPREQWDYRIIDDNGREVWAKDLAHRYRTELSCRQKRDYTTRITKGKGRKRRETIDDLLSSLWYIP